MKRVTTGDSVFGSNPLRGSPWLEKGAARDRTLKAGRRTDSGWGGGSVSLCPYSGGRRRRGWMGLLGGARGSARAREYRRMAAGSGQRAASWRERDQDRMEQVSRGCDELVRSSRG